MFEIEIKKINKLTKSMFNQLETVKTLDLCDSQLNCHYVNVGYVLINDVKTLLLKKHNQLYKCSKFKIINITCNDRLSLYGVSGNSCYSDKSQKLPEFSFSIGNLYHSSCITYDQSREYSIEEIENFKTDFEKRVRVINTLKSECLKEHIFL